MKMLGAKLIAQITLICFLSTQVISTPIVMAASSINHVSPNQEIPTRSTFRLSIPSDLGKIESLHPGEGPALIHIQTAHGNYEAQKNIQAILTHLKNNYGIKTVLVEGGVSKLDPELGRVFPNHPKETMEVLEKLTREAMIKGHDLFLVENPDAEGYGIENLAAYEKNIASFRKVILEKEKTENFLHSMDLQIERLASIYLTKPLRDFLKRRELFELRQLPAAEWVQVLRQSALKQWGVDMSHPAQQIKRPMLVRVFTIGEIEAKLDAQALAKERTDFLSQIRILPEELKNAIHRMLTAPAGSFRSAYPETGITVEKCVAALPADFPYEKFPNVNRVLARAVFESELQTRALFREIRELADEIENSMIRTTPERDLLQLLKTYTLLKKLFALELGPDDYDAVRNHVSAMVPSAVAEKFLKLNESSRVRNASFEHLEEIDRLYQTALDFYADVKNRDQWLMENTEAKLSSLNKNALVVITGGFHAGPFEEYFSSMRTPYALITPKMGTSEIPQELDARSRYIQAVLKYPAPDDSTLETPEIFSSHLPPVAWKNFKNTVFDLTQGRPELRNDFMSSKSSKPRDEVRSNANHEFINEYEFGGVLIQSDTPFKCKLDGTNKLELTNLDGQTMNLAAVSLHGNHYLTIGDSIYLVMSQEDGSHIARIDRLNPLGNLTWKRFFDFSPRSTTLHKFYSFPLPIDPPKEIPAMNGEIIPEKETLRLFPMNLSRSPDRTHTLYPKLKDTLPEDHDLDQIRQLLHDRFREDADQAKRIRFKFWRIISDLVFIALHGTANDYHDTQSALRFILNNHSECFPPEYQNPQKLKEMLLQLSDFLLLSYAEHDWKRMAQWQEESRAYESTSKLTLFERPVEPTRLAVPDIENWEVADVQPIVAGDPEAPFIPQDFGDDISHSNADENKQTLIHRQGSTFISSAKIASLIFAGGAATNVKNKMKQNKLVHLALRVITNLTKENKLNYKWISIIQARIGLLLGQNMDSKIVVATGVSGTAEGESDRSIRETLHEHFPAQCQSGQIKTVLQRLALLFDRDGLPVRYKNGQLAVTAENHLWSFLALLLDKEKTIEILEKTAGIISVGNGDNILNEAKPGMIGYILNRINERKKRRNLSPIATVAICTPAAGDVKGGIAVKVRYRNKKTNKLTDYKTEFREISEFPTRNKSATGFDAIDFSGRSKESLYTELDKKNLFIEDFFRTPYGQDAAVGINNAFYAVDLKLLIARIMSVNEEAPDLINQLKQIGQQRWVDSIIEIAEKVPSTIVPNKKAPRENGDEEDTQGYMHEQAVQDFIVNALSLLEKDKMPTPIAVVLFADRASTFLPYKGKPQDQIDTKGNVIQKAKKIYDLFANMWRYVGFSKELFEKGGKIALSPVEYVEEILPVTDGLTENNPFDPALEPDLTAIIRGANETALREKTNNRPWFSNSGFRNELREEPHKSVNGIQNPVLQNHQRMLPPIFFVSLILPIHWNLTHELQIALLVQLLGPQAYEEGLGSNASSTVSAIEQSLGTSTQPIVFPNRVKAVADHIRSLSADQNNPAVGTVFADADFLSTLADRNPRALFLLLQNYMALQTELDTNSPLLVTAVTESGKARLIQTMLQALQNKRVQLTGEETFLHRTLLDALRSGSLVGFKTVDGEDRVTAAVNQMTSQKQTGMVAVGLNVMEGLQIPMFSFGNLHENDLPLAAAASIELLVLASEIQSANHEGSPEILASQLKETVLRFIQMRLPGFVPSGQAFVLAQISALADAMRAETRIAYSA